MFLLGAAALVAVWVGRPYWRPTNADRVKAELREARAILNRPSPDLNRAQSLCQKALEKGTAYPQFVGEANYLLGCIYLKQADDAPDADAKLQDARHCFEQAEASGVPESDQPKLDFRLGKVLAKVEPVKALEFLRKGNDPESEGERWQLLAKCCMEMNPPDIKGAIDATNNQIPHLLQGDGRNRAEAFYRLADLHLRRNQVPEARKALDEIRVPDSQEVYDSSRVLLARCYQADGAFPQAASTWEQVRSKAKPAIDKGTIDFELGLCYWKAGRSEDARKAWDEAQTFGGEPAQASLLRKAEMQLTDIPNRAQAISTLEDAFKTVQKPADYRNSLYSSALAQQLLEKSCLEFKATADWAGASKLADLLTRLSGSTKGKELAAEIALAWGQSLKKKATTESGQAAKHDAEEAAKQFRTAATAVAELATPDKPPEVMADFLMRSAYYYLECNDKVDTQNASAMLERAQKLGATGAVGSELNYLRAVVFQRLGETDKALEAYRSCMAPDNPKQYRARCDMVVLVLDQPASREEKVKRLSQAAEDLMPNLDPAVRDRDPKAAEDSAYDMGYLYCAKQEWSQAEGYLKAALQQYPKSDEALGARLQLSNCYWYMAILESRNANDSARPDQERDNAQKRRQEFLEKSREVAEPLQQDLIRLEQESNLSEANHLLLWLISVRVADCYYYLGKTQDAVRLYNDLLAHCTRPGDQLVVYSQLWQCHLDLEQFDKCAAMTASVRDLLKTMADDAFENKNQNRDFWEKWLKQADASLARLRKPTGAAPMSGPLPPPPSGPPAELPKG
jgi:tetratricopeptide (TPR) repeat protein